MFVDRSFIVIKQLQLLYMSFCLSLITFHAVLICAPYLRNVLNS